jgi:hypothetical protein
MQHGRSAVAGGQCVQNECESPEVLRELEFVAEDLEKALVSVPVKEMGFPYCHDYSSRIFSLFPCSNY